MAPVAERILALAGSVRANANALAILLLTTLPFLYFLPVTLGQSVWFTTDILRLYYPFALELQRALNANRLPLWTNDILAGFPLFAEGQVGALYPLNILLLKILPAYSALSFGVLFHLAFASCGMYLFVRALALGRAGAMLAGLVFSFNGWIFGHLSHPSVLAALAWLPWSLYFLARWQQSHASLWFLLVTISITLQYLSGSVQIAFLNSLMFCLVGVASEFFRDPEGLNVCRNLSRTLSRLLLRIGLPLALGLGIAGMQLVPTAELVGYSVRRGTDMSFNSSYSLPPEFLQQFVSPFFQGEPSEGTGEYWAYFGIQPLALAILSLFLCRNRWTVFFSLLGILMASLALGGNNPIFSLIYRLPLFGFFRVPARYLYLFIFSAAICAAFSLDALSNRLSSRPLARPRAAFAFAVMLFLILALVYTQPLDYWMALWRVLPPALSIVSIALIVVAFKIKFRRELYLAVILGITMLDLSLYAPPFLKTIDELTPVSTASTQPRSLPVFQTASGRVYTDLSIFPSVPALRNSMYPNVGMVYRVPSAQAYTSLSFSRHDAYFSIMSPAMLNLLNTRWFAVPLEPRPSGDRLTPPEQFYLALGEGHKEIVPTVAHAILVSSFTEGAQDLVDGTVVAELQVIFRDTSWHKFPIRVGIETADWDYDRKRGVAHKLASVAHSFPAFWRSFGRAFEGHTYLARFDFSPRELAGLSLHILNPEVKFNIEQILLLDASSPPYPLAKPAHKSDLILAYMSDTVAVWENQDARPRAFILHGTEIIDDNAVFARMQDASFEPSQTALVSEGHALRDIHSAQDAAEVTQSESERVAIRAQTDAAGYLILLDSWYPGWVVSVDGDQAPIYRADALFRAVPLDPGSHTVVFEYRPQSLVIGAAISLTAIGLSLGSAFAIRRKPELGV